MIDKDGRLNLTHKLCQRCDYAKDMKVWFVMEEDAFRLVPPEDLTTFMKMIASAKIGEKNRITIPDAVRSHYTSAALAYGWPEENYIFVKFFDRAKNTRNIDGNGRIALTNELCELCGYEAGENVWFALETDNTYRIVKETEDLSPYKIVDSVQIDSKRRVTVPKRIRSLYEGEAIVYATLKERHIFISFFERKK